MTEKFLAEKTAIENLIAKAEAINEETYRAWVCQGEAEFPTFDAQGNYKRWFDYGHDKSQYLINLWQQHVAAYSLLQQLADARRSLKDLEDLAKIMVQLK